MAFKLKSPFHVTKVEQSLKKGGIVSERSERTTNQGMLVGDIAEASDGNQGVKPEPEKKNKAVEDLVKKAEGGMPLGLNPKQEARFKTRKYKKGLRDDAKFDRQTEKAKNIYERNQFENLDGGFKNPEEAAGIKSDRAEKSLERDSKFKILESDFPFEEKEKMINDIDSKSQFFNDKIIKAPTNMEGNIKPNRAGTPVRMLKSMEDTTPMKYKSVRKTGRENLMSALAKKGGVEETEMVNDYTTNLDSGVEIDLGPAPKKKAIPKKSDIKKKETKGKDGKVVINRKVATKF